MIAPNPYAAPQSDPDRKRSMVGASFSHQGAICSALVPVGVVLLNLAVWGLTGWEGGVGMYLQTLLSCTGLIVIAISLVLALVGMLGGLLQRSLVTVAFAVAGLGISLAAGVAVLMLAR